MKEQIIDIPENFKIKKITSNKIILVEKKKKLTYEDIAKILFPDNNIHYFTNDIGNINNANNTIFNCCYSNNALSKKQLEKLLAINKLMNVAKYVNGDWKPDWHNNEERKYFITIYNDYNNNKIKIELTLWTTENVVYFKSEEAAKKAINILGEDTIRLAFSNY